MHTEEEHDFYYDLDFQKYFRSKFSPPIPKYKYIKILNESKQEWIEMLNEKEREKNNENEY